MKIAWSLPQDGAYHAYCLGCGAEAVSEHEFGHQCGVCRQVLPRALILDPEIAWWLGDDGEYWHEAAGVFVANEQGKFLFFERTRYPFGLTVPAGHKNKGEPAVITAARELGEETGIWLAPENFRHIATDNTIGDQCRRGSDAHRWHAFVVRVASSAPIKVDASEGARPVWLTLQQALERNPTFVMDAVIRRHGQTIYRTLR